MRILKLAAAFIVSIGQAPHLAAESLSENLEYYFMVPSTSSRYAYKYKDYDANDIYDIYTNLDLSRYQRLGSGVLLVVKCSDVKLNNDEVRDLRNYVCSSGEVGSVIETFIQYPELSVFSRKRDIAYVRGVLLDYLDFLEDQDSSKWKGVSGYRTIVKEVIGLLDKMGEERE